MVDAQYAVVFQGEFVDGFNPEQVKAKFARIFNLTADRVEAIFTRPKVILQRNLTREEAIRYQKLLTQAGLTTYLEQAAALSGAATVQAKPSAAAGAVVEPAPTKAQPQAARERPVVKAAEEASGQSLAFEFHGSGKEFFRIWIVNVLLTVVTLGIYSAWAKVRTHRYFYGNTELSGGRFDYLASPTAILKGRIIALVLLGGYSLVMNLWPMAAPAALLVLLLVTPWLIVRSLMFRARFTTYRGVRFAFTGKVGEAYTVFALLPIVGALTVGLLMPYVMRRQHHYLVANSRYGKTPFTFDANTKSYYGMAARVGGLVVLGGLIGAVAGTISPALPPLVFLAVYLLLIGYVQVSLHNLKFNNSHIAGHGFASAYELGSYAMLHITNTLAMVLTLGLFYPWAKVRKARYAADHMAFIAVGDLDRFTAERQAEVSAMGEEIGEVFDVDIGL